MDEKELSKKLNNVSNVAKNSTPDSITQNVCVLLIELWDAVFFDDKDTKEIAKKMPENCETIAEFCFKNNFGKSSIFQMIKNKNLKNKSYYGISLSKKNTPIHFVEPLAFLDDIIKISDSQRIKNKALRARELYKREKDLRGRAHG